MTRETLEEWVRYLPDDSPYFEWLPYVPQPGGPSTPDKFLQRILDEGTCVMDPQFGWHFAKAFAEQGEHVPECVTEHEWILRAHNFLMFRDHDPEMNTIIRLHLNPVWSRHRDIIKAALLSQSADMNFISEITAIPIDVINGYDQLFFNVRDRKQEMAYLSFITYPNGTLIEMMDGYLLNEDTARIMMRVAFMHDIDTAITVAGIPNDSMSEYESEAYTKRMKGLIMSNALQVARMGGLHQPSAPAIHHGRTIIAAQESAGEGQDGPYDPLMEISMEHSMMDEIEKISKEEKRLNQVIEIDVKMQEERQRQVLSAAGVPSN